MTAHTPISSILKQSFRENYKPGLLLQSAALAIVLLYFFNPHCKLLLQSIGTWKKESGILFSGFSTAIFGGLLPFSIMVLAGRMPSKKWVSLLVFYLLFWFWKGMEVDLMYQFQAYLYGNSNHWTVVLKKVITDQLIYCPIWAVPTMMGFYLWKDADFKFSNMRKKLKEDSFLRRIFRVFASNLVVWVPAVTIIYQLPLDLQLPLFNIVLAFWTLILNSVASK